MLIASGTQKKIKYNVTITTTAIDTFSFVLFITI